MKKTFLLLVMIFSLRGAMQEEHQLQLLQPGLQRERAINEEQRPLLSSPQWSACEKRRACFSDLLCLRCSLLDEETYERVKRRYICGCNDSSFPSWALFLYCYTCPSLLFIATRLSISLTSLSSVPSAAALSLTFGVPGAYLCAAGLLSCACSKCPSDYSEEDMRRYNRNAFCCCCSTRR